MVHSPEEQLLSLSPAPSSRPSSNHVTQESFANLYDDGSDRQESQAGPSTILRTHDISAMYTPFFECPIVTHDLYIPLPTTIRGYIELPKDKCTHPPYPLRKRQPQCKRLERTYHPFLDKESHTVEREGPSFFRRATKRHSLASGQIDRLVHACRGAAAEIHDSKHHQNKSDTGVFWPMVTTSPPPPPPQPPQQQQQLQQPVPNNGPSRIAFDAHVGNNHISPAVSPPRHPFER